ncbi:class I SAM-dependent methyltransferase [Geobacter anodireducens]|uniref:Methyltransferase type 11 n=1 Tax=Geobacter soli TaxID=1510391 RepID=A0A0C1U8Q1_9BACT|nr:class I SAM-dependent methyltransferase [Geobacter soli]KIE43950.1 methyltransferase type 11 [Geobacter soli]
MKVRDSGMPEESVWAGFFSPESILASFGLDGETKDVVEFGCGYGTFTLAAARLVGGAVFTFDIEPDMVATVCEKTSREGVWNVVAEQRDVVEEGTGLPDNFAETVLLFNILHHHEPVALMAEAFRVLRPGGRAAVIHWNYDETTPRGPSMDIRPRPEQCVEWGEEAGFFCFPQDRFDFRPYHYGLLLRKPL